MKLPYRPGRRLRKAWARMQREGFSPEDLERIMPAHTVWWATRRALGFYISSEVLTRVGATMRSWRTQTLQMFERGEITYQRAVDITRMLDAYDKN